MNREQKVEFFHKIMGQPMGEDPKKVPLHLRQLAINIIFEELQELAEASGCANTFSSLCSKNAIIAKDSESVDEVLQLDALCDVQYTLSWAINVLGHRTNFEKAYDETCRSNNTKACKTLEEAEETKKFWTEEDEEEHFIDTVVSEGETYYVVKRSHDGKVRKSINYSPANFEQFFQN